jgi:hypothetical protein
VDHQALVSTYTRQFDKISDAKANLQNKMKTTFFAKYPNRKRGPGLHVNLEKLWTLAKLDDTVVSQQTLNMIHIQFIRNQSSKCFTKIYYSLFSIVRS